MLPQKLKEATKEHHDQLEELMYVKEIMDKTLAPIQFQKLILANYLAHRVQESQIHQAIPHPISVELDLAQRQKLPALQRDLTQYEIKIPASLSIEAVEFTSYEALGALYVMEGATLGGQMISKQLQANPNFTNLPTSHYYGIYGKDLGEKWKKFVEVLNTIAEEKHDEVIAGAKNMFGIIADISKRLTATFD